MSSDVIWHIRDKLWPMPKHGSIKSTYVRCMRVSCNLPPALLAEWPGFLRATVVTRGWNGYRNKSQHRKSTLEKKILPPFQQGFEPSTFQSRVRCSNHWAIPAPFLTVYVLRLISCFGAAQAVKQSSSFSKFICAPFGKKTGGGSQWRPNRIHRTKSCFVLNLVLLMMSGKTKHGNLKSQWIFRSASIF